MPTVITRPSVPVSTPPSTPTPGTPPPIPTPIPSPLSTPGTAAGPARQAPVEEATLDRTHRQLVEAHQAHDRIVSVIGFSESGKTFLVNRLRHDLGDAGGWKSDPREQAEIRVSPAGIELTRLVPRMRRLPRRRPYNYVVVDCAGESLRAALRQQDQSRTLQGESALPYLAAVGLASAYVLVLRADDVSGQGESETRARLEAMFADFHLFIAVIAEASARLRRHRAETFLHDGMRAEALERAFSRNRTRVSRPMCVLFAQADRLRGDDYDLDPCAFARQRARRLWNAVTETFDHYRFDFLSAFHGHAGGFRADYTNPSHGAVEAFRWIHELLRPGLPPLLRGHVPTRHVDRLRLALDRSYAGRGNGS
jgi:hypothetical protein